MRCHETNKNIYLAGKSLTKREAFDILWVEDEWYMMGYDKDSLFSSMTKENVLDKYKQWRERC